MDLLAHTIRVFITNSTYGEALKHVIDLNNECQQALIYFLSRSRNMHILKTENLLKYIV